MANNLTGNPVIVDTAAATPLLTGMLNITKIRWWDSGADIAEGDSAIVQDAAGAVVWSHRAGGIGTVADLVPPVESNFVPGHAIKGLLIPTLTHGTLHIYLDQSRTSVPVKT
jgi:hypothetical protein